MRAARRQFVRLLVAAVALAAAGCDDNPGLGQPCNVLCQTGLSCSAAHICVKSCHCAMPTPTCTPANLASGCTPNAQCVVTAPTGDGVCVARCDVGDLGVCPPGQSSCASAPDGTELCVGPDFGWWTPDLGATD